MDGSRGIGPSIVLVETSLASWCDRDSDKLTKWLTILEESITSDFETVF